MGEGEIIMWLQNLSQLPCTNPLHTTYHRQHSGVRVDVDDVEPGRLRGDVPSQVDVRNLQIIAD